MRIAAAYALQLGLEHCAPDSAASGGAAGTAALLPVALLLMSAAGPCRPAVPVARRVGPTGGRDLPRLAADSASALNSTCAGHTNDDQGKCAAYVPICTPEYAEHLQTDR